MNWTRPDDILEFVQRQWVRGRLLVGNGFPLRVPLKAPNSSQLADLFPQVQAWIAELRQGEGLYRLEYRTLRHRLIGANRIPSKIWIDDSSQALEMLEKTAEKEAYARLCQMTEQRCPALREWLTRRPLRALELAPEWTRLLDVITWILQNPDSGLYIRQVDFPGVHTKFIEEHRSVLSEMLHLLLPQEPVGTSFERRFGFREKSTRVRFRLLDRSAQLPDELTDISLASEEFARFVPGLRRVFITENEINFLVFPAMPDSLVVFGAGYSIDQLGQAEWLREREIFYWGDIDTHGFAILDQLRKHFPQAKSLLMDEATLFAHRDHWQVEKKPTFRTLEHLAPEELRLYESLAGVRLEQEIIGYPWLQGYLARIAGEESGGPGRYSQQNLGKW